ncbi:DUF3016 domain-containing protein [Pelagicoccus sp. SDUM812003]|uniref:DUF3016 domain-containing protein n=1 Tax=Pelagicoccus sp. SDUM812003 TaxID=3041267 RepID=UPI00280F8AB5|nr:DUF3016 domain-containing protein [Pelagicoccus sp. SDUM812003]MDQ8202450.1 DUF3016 domain-containing protein [Pelagicoccus sp. SDUM812003]
MKHTRSLLAIGSAIALSLANFGHAITTDAANSAVQVVFTNSDNYRDIRTSSFKSSKQEKAVLREVEAVFVKQGQKYLPAGYTLRVEVSDIDLAGDQSTLTSPFGEYRVMTDLYPPRIAFAYSVIAPDETVVSSGDASLTDLSYLHTLKANLRLSDSRAPYVSKLIEDWSSKDLRRALETKM